MKILRNTIVFGIILFLFNYVFAFVFNKVTKIYGFNELLDSNFALSTIITALVGIIIYLVSMILTKQIVSLKFKINYAEAKRCY